MTITIRNSALEATIRRIGERTGEGPEVVVARAMEILERQKSSAPKDDRAARLAKLLAKRPPRDPNVTWQDIEKEMDSIF